MAIIERRIFHGKINSADQLVELMREGNKMMESAGVDPSKTRILTDYLSGRTDRVVWEYEVASLAEMEKLYGSAMSDPAMEEAFGKMMGRITELVEYAEVEHWSVQ